jgi:hypothetical protein
MNKTRPVDKVLKFINSFIQADYEANIACYKEKDYDKFTDIVLKTKKFLDKEIVTLTSRGWEFSDEDWAIWYKQGDDVIPRSLFQIKVYKHAKLGLIYRCYLGTNTKDQGMYAYSFYVAEKKSGYRIITIDSACVFCSASGKTGKLDCYDCKGLGWKYYGGMKLNIYKQKPVEIIKIEEPTWPEYLVDYNKD